MPQLAETTDLYAALPADLRERFDRARGDLAAITSWLDSEGEQVSDEAAEQVCTWAESIASLVWGEPLKLYAPEPEQLTMDGEDREPTAEAHYTTPGEPPEVVFEVDGDEIRMAFKASRAQFSALEKHGRQRALATNVLYPLPPWSDELCARWAVQEAITNLLAEAALSDQGTGGPARG